MPSLWWPTPAGSPPSLGPPQPARPPAPCPSTRRRQARPAPSQPPLTWSASPLPLPRTLRPRSGAVPAAPVARALPACPRTPLVCWTISHRRCMNRHILSSQWTVTPQHYPPCQLVYPCRQRARATPCLMEYWT